MKTHCASCEKFINKKGKSDIVYYNSYGNFCSDCSERAGKNCMHHYQENIETFSYAFQTDKNKENEKSWKRKGYLS